MAAIPEELAMAVRHHMAGRRQAAEQIYRKILEENPRQPDALHLLGVLALEVGQHALAIDYIGRAIRLRGNVSAFHNNLGEAYRAAGEIAAAMRCYQRAVKLQRNYAEAHNNLGLALSERQELNEAIGSFHKAIQLKPRYAEAHNNLGNAFKRQGKLDQAVASYRRALEAKPDYAKAHFNLGAALKDQGNRDAAVACFRRALELKPDFAEALSNLGNALWEQGRLDEAVACCRDAVRIRPDFAEAHNNLANALRDQGELDEALRCYQTAVQLRPDFAEAQSNLGDALVESGRLREAEPAFRRALESRPAFAPAHTGLAMLLRGALPEADRMALEGLLAKGQFPDDVRADLQFALAQTLDGQGDYLRASDLLRQANALRLRHHPNPYDPAGHERFVAGLALAFDADFFARLGEAGLDTPQPVFVLGLPRSGTTLIEQILSSHPQIHGAGELPLAQHSFDAVPALLEREGAPLDSMTRLDAQSLRLLAERHLDSLRKIAPRGAQRVVDKMPENYLYLGLLAAMFPRATFIHCRRELRDVAVSCWATDFRRITWANDLEHIASHFRQYLRIMEHWRLALPAPLHHVDYEETVADLEGVARRLVSACGLEWDPACLRFHETVRPIRTASVGQVRQQLYQKSVGRWRNYETALGEFLARLAMDRG